MENEQKSSQVSEIIYDLSQKGKDITIADILGTLKGRGIALLMAVFSVPAAMPVPAPILATILGIPLVLLTLQLFLGKKSAWLPERIKTKQVPSDILESASKWLKRLEFFLHPRLGFLVNRFMISIFCLIFAIVMMFPVPLTNTVPAFAILLIALGLFERDGLFVIGGMFVGSIWCGLLGYATYVAGDEFVEFIREML